MRVVFLGGGRGGVLFCPLVLGHGQRIAPKTQFTKPQKGKSIRQKKKSRSKKLNRAISRGLAPPIPYTPPPPPFPIPPAPPSLALLLLLPQPQPSEFLRQTIPAWDSAKEFTSSLPPPPPPPQPPLPPPQKRSGDDLAPSHQAVLSKGVSSGRHHHHQQQQQHHRPPIITPYTPSWTGSRAC